MIKAIDPRRSSSGPRSGAGRLLLQRLRPAVRQRARLEHPARPQQPRRHGLPALAARPAAPAQHGHRPAAARHLHRPLLPAGRRVQRRRLERDAAAAQPLDALAVGSELRRRDLDQRPRAARSRGSGAGSTPTIRARRSASPSTTGAPRTTSTAPRPRPTSSASSAARGSTWRRAGRRRPPARRPTRRSRCTATTTATSRRSARRACAAAAPNPDAVSAFAAQRAADGALTVMVINKVAVGQRRRRRSTSPTSLTAGPPQVWQLTSANAITRLADVALAGNALSTTLPPQSITLFVIAKASGTQVTERADQLQDSAAKAEETERTVTTTEKREAVLGVFSVLFRCFVAPLLIRFLQLPLAA